MHTCTLSQKAGQLLKSELCRDYQEEYSSRRLEINAFIDTFIVCINQPFVQGNWSTYNLEDNATHSGIYGFVLDFILGDLSKNYYNLTDFKPQESVEIFL